MLARLRSAFQIFGRFPILITQEARSEYLTQRILGGIAVTMPLFWLLVAVFTGLRGLRPLAPLVLMSFLLIISIVGWRLAMTGRWRWVYRLPTIMFFLLATYGATLSYESPLTLFYVVASMFSALLVGPWEMLVVLALGLAVNYGWWLAMGTVPLPVLLLSMVTLGGSFMGIALLQWLSISLMDRALANSTRDALTGLFNRGFFDAEMGLLQNGRRYPVSILVFDLNGLKTVNDVFGHAAGDALIIRAADALHAAMRKDDVVCRIGGDEFVALLPKTDAAAAEKILARLEGMIDRHNQAGPQPALSLAAGGATAAVGESLQDCFVLADSRMYDNKERQKRGLQPAETE